MLLGVDRSEDLSIEPIGGQRIAAVLVGLGVLALPLLALWSTDGEATGARAAEGSLTAISGEANDNTSTGRSPFTNHRFAFEFTPVPLGVGVIEIRRASWRE